MGVSTERPDPVRVDPKHYVAEIDDEHARVLRIRYGAKETSPMHWHPAGVAILLTDSNERIHMADGSTQDVQGKAGEVVTTPAGEHAPENLSDQAFEAILVEFKR